MEPVTYARISPTTGRRQTRTVDTPAGEVQLRANGWTAVPFVPEGNGQELPAEKPATKPRKATGAAAKRDKPAGHPAPEVADTSGAGDVHAPETDSK